MADAVRHCPVMWPLQRESKLALLSWILVNVGPGGAFETRPAPGRGAHRWNDAPATTTTAATPDEHLVALLQNEAASIASTFRPEPFDPWITDCHMQTIGGYFLRRYCAYVPKNDPLRTTWLILNGIVSTLQHKLLSAKGPDEDSNFWHTRERVETPDGDWFHADIRYATSPSASNGSNVDRTPTVILLHGLESNSYSLVSKHMAQSFTDIGMDCICLNFRGCSGAPNNQLKAYHLGFTEDLAHYLDRMRASASENIGQKPIYLAGFSLGANVVLKFLGEISDRAVTDYNIQGAAILCTPLDQERNAHILAQPGINRAIYTSNLLQSLKRRVRDQLERLCNGDENTDLFDYPGTQTAETIIDFDDAYHPKVFGFKDCWDYYRKTSSIHYLDRVTVPVLMLQAKDDPFLDPDVWPVYKSAEYGGPLPLKMVRTEHGGHLGYCFHQVPRDDNRLWTTRQQQGELMVPSWFAVEMARFLEHVHSSTRLNGELP